MEKNNITYKQIMRIHFGHVAKSGYGISLLS